MGCVIDRQEVCFVFADGRVKDQEATDLFKVLSACGTLICPQNDRVKQSLFFGYDKKARRQNVCEFLLREREERLLKTETH